MLDSERVYEDIKYALESLENGVEWTLEIIVREFRSGISVDKSLIF